ncbi:MAG: carboxypeptidase-like regulatory domain-containing protein [Bacteroidales bacterium]|nr:carboxypeptidase-like regulatory domain-containing protein [Bacteroidales bacterium]
MRNTKNLQVWLQLNLVLIFIVVFSFLSVNGQTQQQIITGYVVDSETQIPIPNTHIVSIESKIGVVSDDDGYFKMIVPISSITLEFSFIGYVPKQISLPITADTNLLVNLVSKTFELGEVAIKSDNNTYNPQINKYSVLDYGFIGDSLLVLQKRRSLGGLPSLVLLNRNFDTISVNNMIPKGAYQIFKDCLNSHHIITKDSAYQIAVNSDVNNDGIVLYKPYGIRQFYQIMAHCLFRKEGDIFFEFPIYQGYGHEIIFFNEKDKTKNLFVRYVDSESYSNMVGDISEISSLFYLHSVINASTNDSLTIAHINNYNHESRYIRELGSHIVKNHLCLFKDTIFYFNYYESMIQVFPNINAAPLKVVIDYKHTKGWGINIQIDLVEDKLYSIIKTKGYYKVYRINAHSGDIEYMTRLSVFKGGDLKINNGFMYYLSHAGATAGQVQKLSRNKLQQ